MTATRTWRHQFRKLGRDAPAIQSTTHFAAAPLFATSPTPPILTYFRLYQRIIIYLRTRIREYSRVVIRYTSPTYTESTGDKNKFRRKHMPSHANYFRPLLAHVLTVAFATYLPAISLSQHLPTAEPSEVGMDPTRLSKIDEAIGRRVKERDAVGVSVLVSRHGKVVYFKQFGQMDAESGKPRRFSKSVSSFCLSLPSAKAQTTCSDLGRHRVAQPLDRKPV